VLSSIKFFYRVPRTKGDRCAAIAHKVVSGRLAKLSTVDRPGNVAWVSDANAVY
jgi:hypothetical protein